MGSSVDLIQLSMRLTFLLLLLLALVLISECRRKTKPPGKKPKPPGKKPKPPGKKPKPPAKKPPGKKPPAKPVKPKPPAINYARYTKEPTGGTCWWDLARKDCAICKQGGMQCGYPLQNKCYKKHPTQGCPGIEGNTVTLSEAGYPCYFDLTKRDCAWCGQDPKSLGFQTNQNLCVAARFQQKFDAVKGDCQHIPKCDDNATCQQLPNGINKCVCNFGYTGTGIQCADGNGTLATPAGVVLASLELNLDNTYFSFVNGEEIPLSG